eukprot:CAMPEP_0184236412 /NCGR_PEP_ID=MMETSP0976-20121227/25814_1 /TAXON_ID=483370 /ORGANISM="non described non described, Strain CCMP2097" /LENGTH=50 /DNA_ID=CAMNT_0026541511 /DNA_START=11 /DNA_END=159 /DNA_ORIENTATION=-
MPSLDGAHEKKPLLPVAAREFFAAAALCRMLTNALSRLSSSSWSAAFKDA